MANVLEKIVKDKRKEVEQRKQARPLADFVDRIKPTEKSFFAALSAESTGFIFECKKASPSKGLIRAHFDLEEIITAYAPHAACISVLTDEKYFQGTYEYLDFVTQRVTQPVINKDFFIDEYQVHLARVHGADAILLMLSVLNDDEYRTLATLARQYSMDVLTEVSNEQEMHRAIALQANIIGINNRNLRDLSTDLATTERLVPLLKDVDFEHVVISESGIYTHQDVARLSPFCDGFLVGSALMAQDDLARAVTDLLYPAVKVCGITTVEQAQWVADSPAHYAGLIFAAKSPRAVSLADAQVIAHAVAQPYVGVFVDEDIDTVASYADTLSLSVVQLHGSESTEYMAALRERLADCCEIWKALGISESLPAALTDPNNTLRATCNRVLLDCQVGSQSGGTGKQFDWSLLSQIESLPSVVLAGGISPQNARQAAATGVGLIDVNSGVEALPGHKDKQKLDALFSALRAY
ncbi:bifunctional indole-3-glycerol-phosphate synthase TrpC/phosphoribosylanthranilate isomerase TrpF [Alteromonas oceanisediminis]|uniref:bifunctional indole-3-glycerol-phosphate synthase TrpC/phosphoribosylanthranilate isomerase TrpF n=1 Tax=Alteromonas oceanisediminis TaxID=2836180 RepID=UPI001BD965D1|nr:bifunctional indole-3-glycerol-phosphate synthase TrpC/phosphoribosylanthranilate isomerase TrpF [Alteromonas oceanisediminis]MBT0588057.1 bifunctional indole-3-glycerol-phosphate synthase TrpC/phosphoribosylanthranilate isomerase TrpF [Alteromonas oceanisediminis]